MFVWNFVFHSTRSWSLKFNLTQHPRGCVKIRCSQSFNIFECLWMSLRCCIGCVWSRWWNHSKKWFRGVGQKFQDFGILSEGREWAFLDEPNKLNKLPKRRLNSRRRTSSVCHSRSECNQSISSCHANHTTGSSQVEYLLIYTTGYRLSIKGIKQKLQQVNLIQVLSSVKCFVAVFLQENW